MIGERALIHESGSPVVGMGPIREQSIREY
jgi:hypothetical protein